jgi:hypothetical protein
MLLHPLFSGWPKSIPFGLQFPDARFKREDFPLHARELSILTITHANAPNRRGFMSDFSGFGISPPLASIASPRGSNLCPSALLTPTAHQSSASIGGTTFLQLSVPIKALQLPQRSFPFADPK